MMDKCLDRSFRSYYYKRRIKGSPRGDRDGNPESFEEYLTKTSVENVIMKAFYFSPLNNSETRTTYTYDYWKDIDDKWQEYMKSNASNFTNDAWPLLRKTFAILRQNWDEPYYWKRENLESTEEVYKRMHIDLPLPELRWPHGYVEKPLSLPEPASSQCPEVLPQEQPEEQDPLADFEFFEPDSFIGSRLRPNEVSLNFKSGYKMTFNATVSLLIINNGMRYARLARNRNGDICLILNRNEGALLSKMNKVPRKSNSVTLNSKDLTLKLRTLFNVKKEYDTLLIEQLTSTPDYLIYKIYKS